LLCERRKGPIDLARVACLQNQQAYSQGASRKLQFLRSGIDAARRVDEYPNQLWHCHAFPQDLQHLWQQPNGDLGNAGQIASWAIEAPDQTRADWIAACIEDNRDRAGRCLGGKRRGATSGCEDDSDPTTDEIGS
jgi:hypothetical protein